MAYVYKDGKVSNVSISNVKLPKSLIKKVDAKADTKDIIKAAIETVKKAKVAYAF